MNPISISDRLLRRREVETITGLSRSTIYRLMQESDFPRPVRIGPGAVRWKVSDIKAWDRIATSGEERV